MKVWVADNQKLTHRYAAQHAPEQELKPQVHRWGLKPPTHTQEAHVHEAYMLTTLNQFDASCLSCAFKSKLPNDLVYFNKNTVCLWRESAHLDWVYVSELTQQRRDLSRLTPMLLQ